MSRDSNVHLAPVGVFVDQIADFQNANHDENMMHAFAMVITGIAVSGYKPQLMIEYTTYL